MTKTFLPLSDIQFSYFYGRNNHVFLGGVSTHFYVEVYTHITKEDLEKAINAVIKEQPALRSYITGEGTQCFMDQVDYYNIEEINLEGMDEADKEKKLLEYRKKYSERVFSFDNWPMFKFTYFKTGNSKQIFVLDCDMMILDGLSTEILIDRVYYYYNNGEQEIIPIESLKNFSKESILKKEKNYSTDLNFWNDEIENLPKGPEFQISRKEAEFQFACIEDTIDAKIWANISKKLMSERILPAIYLTTAYGKTLSKWSNQKKITINMTISNRKSSDKNIKKAIGDYTEVLLVDFDFDNYTFWENAKRAQKSVSKRKKHADVSSSEIIRRYVDKFKLGNQFPFPAVCTSMLFDKAGEKWDWVGNIRYQISQTPQVILDNQMTLKEGKLQIHWDYRSIYFDDYVIKNMLKDYKSVILESSHILQEENMQIFKSYNNTFVKRNKSTLVQLFLKQVERTPEKIVISDENNSITYAQLNNESNHVANYIKNTVGIHRPIIINMSRTIKAIITILGVLKSGGYYIPLAENCPEQRLKIIKDQSGAEMIIDDVVYQNLMNETKRFNPIDYSDPDNISYVIYTSGSTGTPKGVVINHDSVVNTLLDINNRFNIGERDAIIGISSFSFDLSVYDIFGALISGAELKLIKDIGNLIEIKKLIEDNEVTVWNTVPSIMGLLVENIDYQFVNKSLRVIMLSGDWIPLNLIEKIKKNFPYAKIYSLGGATEASIWSIYYPIENVDREWKSIPYGYPLENQSMWILDEEDNICPKGMRGEICIGGRGLAKGYLNDKVRTEEHFVEHKSIGPIYRTGDMGVLKDENYIEFLGRKDFQVKLNGYRIELGEIEKVICRWEHIAESVVDVKTIDKRPCLIAYIVPEKDEQRNDYIIDKGDLYEYMQKYLMNYMIPEEIIIIEKLPVTSNGKVDRTKLPVVGISKHNNEEYVSPETPMEFMLQELIETIMKGEKVGVTSNLIHTGMDSLKGITLNTKLKEKGIEIGLADLYSYPTIRQLAEFISKDETDEVEYGEI